MKLELTPADVDVIVFALGRREQETRRGLNLVLSIRKHPQPATQVENASYWIQEWLKARRIHEKVTRMAWRGEAA